MNVLDSPGSADLSAYVDFVALKHTVEEAAGGDFFAALYIFLMNFPGIRTSFCNHFCCSGQIHVRLVGHCLLLNDQSHVVTFLCVYIRSFMLVRLICKYQKQR